MTLEGVREFAPVVFELEPVESCALVDETVALTCHSFLTVYLQSASFGRTAKAGKELCDGERDEDRAKPDEDCLETRAVLQNGRELCHGRSSCSLPVSPDLADFTGCMATDLKRELRTGHICGNNSLFLLLLIIFLQLPASSGVDTPHRSQSVVSLLLWCRIPG